MENSWLKIGGFLLVSLLVSAVVVGLNSLWRIRHAKTPEMRQSSSPSQLSTCVPDLQPDGKIRLTVLEVRNEPDRTSIQVVAQALNEPADFYVPQYLMSRGRWLIHETGRAYLRDEKCNEYKLKDRTPKIGKVPDSGRISLKPGATYELMLSFPRLLDEMKTGVLVYDNWVLPFEVK
jgi:hypothetical protein